MNEAEFVARLKTTKFPWGEGKSYQTIPLPSGGIYPGVKPCVEDWKIFGLDCMGQRVLDLGCNVGVYSLMATREGSYESVGVELDPLFVSLARELADVWKFNEFIEFVQGDLVEFVEEQSDNRFDIIIASNFLYKFDYKKAVELLLEFNRVGKKTLLLSTNMLKSPVAGYQGANMESSFAPGKEELTKLLPQCGYRNIKVLKESSTGKQKIVIKCDIGG